MHPVLKIDMFMRRNKVLNICDDLECLGVAFIVENKNLNVTKSNDM